MARGGINLKLEGFDELLRKIQKAGGTIDQAADSALRASAHIMQNELKEQMHAAGVDPGLIGRMPPPEIEIKGNRYRAEVGYPKGTFNEKDPSDAFKVIFLNYGTPRRKLHGNIEARGFIQKAKKKARPQIKKKQQEVLDKILGRLEK